MILTAASAACSGDGGTTAPIPPAPAVRLKDVVVSHLPSPYYHFEYDAIGRIRSASFASGLTNYDVIYDGGRISEMRNDILVNHDRLLYLYDDAGRVAFVRYVKPDGVVFTVLRFTYDGPKLTGVERSRRVGDGFVVDKTVSFLYYPDGNLRELTKHYPRIGGRQDEANTTDRFEAYDDGRPLARNGELTFLSGGDTSRRFRDDALFSYF